MAPDGNQRPNVIIVLTDDQGYGDLGCTGNPWIQTPNIDRFYEDSLRLSDFHVAPLCTPTRGAMMSGRRPIRNGAWATTWGRSILRRDETTLADLFQTSGYATALFGKWHLGDNYPYRPFDRGFEHVVAHKGGGVGQTPDFWGNNYFDDTYFHNGKPQSHEGYCTDVWFEEALQFIEQNKSRPFFVMISTNAPHSPFLVAKKYRQLYEGNPDICEPAFYGMITNIDENFGRLRKNLAQWGLEENTILIFMTDNGTSAGVSIDRDTWQVTSGYNAGMRGRKCSYYDGGHRVPFFVRWPEAGMQGGKDIQEMTLGIDMLPTFIDLCGLQKPDALQLDGVSFAPLLRGETEFFPGDRCEFINIHQGTEPPDKWEGVVMTRRWRLVYGTELYDIKADPGQQKDISAEQPEVVRQLREANEKWWAQVESSFKDMAHFSLGNDAENPTTLCSMDVMGDVAWNQVQVAEALKTSGQWNVEVERPGRYRFSLRRWPEELPLPIEHQLSTGEAIQLALYCPYRQRGVLRPAEATIKIFGKEYRTNVKKGAQAAMCEIDLESAGKSLLEAFFTEQNEERFGAYYVVVERLS